MKLTCTTQPNTQPVTIEDAKSFCRILTNDDDAIISILIDAATDYAQNVTGRQLCTATYEIVVGGEQSPLRLPKAPLKAITSVMCNGIALEYSLHYDYDVAFIEFSATDDVTITYECGYDVVDVEKHFGNELIATNAAELIEEAENGDEFTELKAKADELGIKYTKESTVEDLTKLIEEAENK